MIGFYKTHPAINEKSFTCKKFTMLGNMAYMCTGADFLVINFKRFMQRCITRFAQTSYRRYWKKLVK